MSSGEDTSGVSNKEGADFGPDTKRRKLMRACDYCRRKRIKCDSKAQSGKTCSNCRENDQACTFIEDSTKRAPPKAYVEALEKRCEILEQAISKIAPDLDLEAEFGPRFDRNNWDSVKRRILSVAPTQRSTSRKRSKAAASAGEPSLVTPNVPVNNGNTFRPSARALLKSRSDTVPEGEDSRSHGLDPLVEDLQNGMERMKISRPVELRYIGEFFMDAVVKLKREAEGTRSLDSGAPKLPPDWSSLTLRRWYWRSCPWEYLSYDLPSPSQLKYPPEDLAASLIELCFTKSLAMLPVLHRPSFERDVKAGLHLKDLNFAKLYLVVCAVGSRHSTDPRVALKAPSQPGGDDEIQWRSAGWTSFQQVMEINRPVLHPAALIDLQVLALSALYLEGSSSPYASAWLCVGAGLRAAQDIGAHREWFYLQHRAFKNQMWRRVFWSLIVLETLTSSGLGRPMTITREDIDAELPLEVDDEYFDEVNNQWKQPIGQPSRLSAFTQYVKLIEHLAKVQAAKSRPPLSRTPYVSGTMSGWRVDIIAELDSALTQWHNNLPEHLAWNPLDPDDIHFEQTTCLKLMYHQEQIIVHQPFRPLLSGVPHDDSLTSPSLTISRHAAQSVIQILEVQQRRGCEVPSPCFPMVFSTGLLSLITIWDAKKSGLDIDTSPQLKDIGTSIRSLRASEDRWHIAGILVDILTGLASVQVPELRDIVVQGRKRTREESILGNAFAKPPPQDSATGGQQPAAAAAWMTGSGPSGWTSEYPVASFIERHDAGAPPPHAFQWVQPQLPQSSTSGSSGLHPFHISSSPYSGVATAVPEFGVDSFPSDPNLQDVLGGFGTMSPEPSWQPASEDWSWLNDLGMYGMLPNLGPTPPAP